MEAINRKMVLERRYGIVLLAGIMPFFHAVLQALPPLKQADMQEGWNRRMNSNCLPCAFL